MGLTKRILLIGSIFGLITSLAFATDYQMRYNVQTGRGDWVVSDTSLYQPSDEAYGILWDNDIYHAPSKNALYDIISTLSGGSLLDEAYGVNWDSDTEFGATRNAIYDVISGLGGGHDAVTLAGQNYITIVDQLITAGLIQDDDINWDAIVDEEIYASGINWTDFYVPDTSVNWAIQVPANESDPVWTSEKSSYATLDSPTFTTKMVLGWGTASELVALNASKELVSLTVATYPSLAELALIKGISANGSSLITAANYAAMRGLLDLEAGTDFYSISAADAAFEAELDNSAGLMAALSDETGSASGSPLSVFNQNPTINGVTGTGAWDLSGATSLKIPTVAGDLTLTSGMIGVDTAQKQLGWHDGIREVAISSDRKITVIITAGDWDLDSDKFVWEFDSTIYPDGVVITKWTVDANVADPDVELNANLMYSDALASGAFPGANATLIDVLDTTTGNSTETNMASSDLGSGVIPAGKIMYVDIDVDPATDTDFFILQIYFYQPES